MSGEAPQSATCAGTPERVRARAQVLLLALGRGPLADATLRLDEFLALLLWPILHLEGEPTRSATHTWHTTTSTQRTAAACCHAGPGGRVLRWEEHALGAAAPADLTPRQKLWRRRGAAAARATHRLAENVLIVGVGAVTLVTPAVPLFLKTYSSGQLSPLARRLRVQVAGAGCCTGPRSLQRTHKGHAVCTHTRARSVRRVRLLRHLCKPGGRARHLAARAGGGTQLGPALEGEGRLASHLRWRLLDQACQGAQAHLSGSHGLCFYSPACTQQNCLSDFWTRRW